MRRTLMQVNGHDYALAQNQDLEALKTRVLQAIRDGGDLIPVTLVGNTSLEVLVTLGVPLTFQTTEVDDDDRDDGNLDFPFDPSYEQYSNL
jgi:hypothetical protein